jgi:hypothetical protein
VKLRITMVIDRELSEQEAFEHYGTVDPYGVAQSMQLEADSKLTYDARVQLRAEHVSIQVVPIG